ncbi:addiction module antitoxin, RelB/DinJ family [Lactobacillus gasseri MV-22]|uniref:DNA-damage-inducible protein J n=3 Tax=Lactobacillus TaxID=1578 RepID=A0A806A6T4_LACGA|nr:DNA-damage-inducible protein J [Lactobacillus gasseri ATCC 33323 = JCM 1131]EFQ46165.1 addiction module antitoxin, RelB/DinJ family [Lactobacillus gasseri MV-22]EJN54630.1 Toxin-antitoxin system, antitoxin component, ribbon-helix-helix fold protein [Lactobacillus gasseri CECT 5714]KFL95823.1 toxin-antitoxin system, antitoxin component, ribbon-helix-helix fold protein [Lactobacillus gasseri SJ-9E-US]
MIHMTTTVSLRLPEDLKKQATDVFNEYGLDWSSAMRMILTQVVSENAIPVNLHRYSEISPSMKSNIDRSLQEYKAGNYKTTNSVKELFEELDKD